MREHCDEDKEKLPLYIDGTGQKTDEDALLRGIRRTAKTLPGLAVTEDFRAGLRNRLEQESQKPKQRIQPLWKMVAGFATAAAVIAFSVMTVGHLPEVDIVSEPEKSDLPIAVVEPVAEDKQDTSVLQDTIKEVPAPQKEEQEEYVLPNQPAMPADQVRKPDPVESQEASIQARFNYATKAVLHYTFEASVYSEAEMIVSVYEFDGEGYKVPAEDIVAVCEKLETLTGYVAHRPSDNSPEAETEEEKELYNSFVWVIIEKAE